jgi:sulfatase modifying factor 1
MNSTRLFALLLVALVCTTSAAITIETVPVGDAGNPNDPGHIFYPNTYGSVSYLYNIDKYEVTVGQYTAFLNAVAATDTYALYNPSMASDLHIAGIAQSCSPNCTYSVIGSPNHPITYVSWGDAARFANWLHNGQPTGTEGHATTETGAYTLNGATTDAALIAVTRNQGAAWFIPSENEWYKAAYYQPAAQGGDSDSYWAYPMKTNSQPYSDQPPGAAPSNARVGNFREDDFIANGYDDGFAVTGSIFTSSGQNYLTDAGAYRFSPSYYGTFDQGGNVSEWNDTLADNLDFAERGGSWIFDSADLRSSLQGTSGPSGEFSNLGFRVASSAVPEPCTAILCIAGGILTSSARKRRRSYRMRHSNDC